MRIAVLSDIHANLVALETVLAAVGTVDAVWQLGDVVGYGPEPDAVVARLADQGARGVRGNHDAAAIGDLGIEDFNTDARHAMEWTRTRISPSTRSWLAALPEVDAVTPFTLVHGSPRDPIWEYVMSTAAAAGSIAALETPYGLHGHTHVPIAFRQAAGGRVEALACDDGDTLPLDDGPRLFLNPGSVGQPRDGDPRASFLVLDTDAATATWRRVPYDIAATQSAMRDAGLPSRLIARLDHGL